jgi:hypothetical protein
MLVPKELKIEPSGGVKAMTDEQIERSIELIKAMPVPALPPPSRKARRKARRSDRADSGLAARVVGTDSADGNS